MNDKISQAHLQRAAYVYIRQSTLQQVRQNVESSRRQYQLQDRAKQLGFQKVIIIDDDLGISGSGSAERPGFARLLNAVCNGEAGAIFALEASRLARNNRDWHHLIDLCVLTETIVIDDEGIYEPRHLNDRLLLGLKGTMSEFELGILRQRALEAYRQKAMRGEVLTRVPVGYVRDGKTGIAITPDREIQQAIHTLFAQFERLGTLRKVFLWHHEENIMFPATRYRHGTIHLDWQLPNYQHLLRAMKNPTYAGAFAWGRSGTRTQAVAGRSRKTNGHKLPMDQWQVLLKDHHPCYITWDRYMENQRILASNRTKTHQTESGAPKNGSALLAGLLRCAQCGHKLHVGYRGSDGRSPRYYCLTGNKEQGLPSCLSFGGVKVERAVVSLVLETCQPLGIKASLEMAKAWTDKYIANLLNRLGLKTGKGYNWSEARVKSVRLHHKIAMYSVSSKREWITTEEAATKLCISTTTFRTMIRNHVLPARQILKGAPLMINPEDLLTDQIRNHLKHGKNRKTSPCNEDHPTLNL